MAEKQQFEEFISKNLDSACRFANIYIKNPQDAEDVVSESIEKAIRKIHTLKDPAMMKTWFFRIIINTALNHLKKQSKTVSRSEELSQHYYTENFSQLYFHDLLDLLSVADRQIVSLRFGEERELNEIAEILGMNENTVKTKLYRALKKLKLEINPKGDRITVKRNRSAIKTLTIMIIAILLSGMCIFNVSPALAAAAYDIPVIGNIIKVITFYRFEYNENGYEAEIIVPEIQGLLDAEFQDRLNAEFRENADDLIRAFEATILEAEELGDESVRMDIKADYIVKTDNDKVLALDTYLYSDIVNYVFHKFYTIKKQTGTLIALSDLFKPDADYITPISNYIVSEMERINKEEDGTFEIGDSPFGAFTKIQSNHSFYINEEGKLVICFDKYEVAAGIQGSPEFSIPTEIVKDILISDLIR